MTPAEETTASFESFQDALDQILPGTEGGGWPIDLQAAVLAWDVLGCPVVERRAHRRKPYRRAILLDINDPADGSKMTGVMLFSRDAHPWAIGFLTKAKLQLNARCTVHIPQGDHFSVVECTVRRCQPFIHGWNEGALHFVDRQDDLCPSEDGEAGLNTGHEA